VCSYQWLNVSEPTVSRRSVSSPRRSRSYSTVWPAAAITPVPPMFWVNVWRCAMWPSWS
jgi:hypothetical protein